jgi:RND family efflux transporter MFP subunit
MQIPTPPILLLALGAILTSSCSRSNAEPGKAEIAVPTVAVARAAPADLSRALVLTAEFKPNQEVDVMAKVAGYIKEIRVDVGDRVNQGDLLATLEIPEMADDLRRANAAVVRSEADVRRANDELSRAEAAHEIADLSYKRLAAVLEKRPGLIAQQEIDDAHSRDMVAEAQIAAARSSLAVADEQVRVNQADTAKIQTLLDYTRVSAPFTGVVTKRYADTGAMIQAALPVVRISENNVLRLILPVPESAVPTVHIGQGVEVRVSSLKRSFPGKVARFSGKLSLQTRTMDTEVDVPNPGLVLYPGMYAEVDLTLARRNRALAVPLTAVDADGKVMVVTPNNRVEVRKIALGLETASQVEVRSGLNEGDLVVIGSLSSLDPGQEVRPKVTTMETEKP